MTRHNRAGGVLTSLTCVVAAGTALGANIAPPAANLPGVGPYHQYTNGMFAQGALGATESTFGVAGSDNWTLDYTNTHARNVWTGFKIGIFADGGGIFQINSRIDGSAVRGEPLRSDVRATAGFGAVAPGVVRFTNDAARFAKNAELAPKNAKAVVAPRSGATIVVPMSGRGGEVYHLQVQPISAAPVAPALPGPGGDGRGGGGMSFNPATGDLGLSGFAMSNLAGDSLEGASVSVPGYAYAGPLADGNHVFQGSGPVTVTLGAGAALTGEAPLMYFDTMQNMFFAKLHAPVASGAGLSSSYVSSMMTRLDPDSPDFDPNADMWLAFRPSVNVGAGTEDFSVSLAASGEASIFVVPSPGVAALLLLGGGLMGMGRRRV